jgi:Wiskott-Aldrich syndrome protein
LKKKKTGLLGFFGKDEDQDELVISEPSNFRHVSNIGWNPSLGSFEINNIPPEWKKLFQGIGIKKSDLKNKETAAYIMNVIEEHGGDAEAFAASQGAQAPSGPAPPPPPPPPGKVFSI